MAKLKRYYEPYSIKRAMKDEVMQISDNIYLVNNKNTVIDNGKMLRCNCKHANDNKLHIKYCHCCLAVLHFIDKNKFWEEIISKEIYKNDTNN